MSGSPIIPINFKAKVVKITKTTVTLEPFNPDAVEYFKNAPIFDVHASPAGQDDSHGDGGDGGDVSSEGNKS